jgi:uncharacterized delta-60 repeat protein
MLRRPSTLRSPFASGLEHAPDPSFTFMKPALSRRLSRAFLIGFISRAGKARYSRRRRVILVILLFVPAALIAWRGTFAVAPQIEVASTACLDSSFNGTGIVTTPIGAGNDYGISAAIQGDGKIVLAGESYNGSDYDFAVVRYNSDGTLDNSFNGTGMVTTSFGSSDDIGISVAIQGDGKLVVAGYSMIGSNYDFTVARYNSDGSLDTSFNGTGKVITDIGGSLNLGHSVAIQGDGKIVVAGWAANGFFYDFAVVRYNSDGSLDTSLNGTGKVTTSIGTSDAQAFSVAMQGDGKIVAAGLCAFNGQDDFAVVRYNSDGSLDTSFNGTGKVSTAIGSSQDIGESVAIQSDGKIVVAGQSYIGSNYDFAVVRYNSDGSLDSSFNGTGKVTTPIGISDDTGSSVAIQEDGKIVVAGTSSGDIAVVRYNSDGSLDTSFNGTGKVTTTIGGLEYAYSAALQADGNIVVAGGTSAGSNYDFAVVRYLGSCAAPTPTPTPTPEPTATPTPQPTATPTPAPTPSPTPTPTAIKVNLSASPAQINEGQGATYTVTASSAVTQPTAVKYTTSGSATNGIDYSLSGAAGQLTIRAGQSSGTVTLKAKADHITEGTETAIMTLQPGSGYKVGRNNQATVSILDSP